MTSNAQVSALHTATGQVDDVGGNDLGRTRLKGAYYVASVAGTIELRDGGASGALRAVIPIGATTDAVNFPGEGLLFNTNVHMTVVGATVTGIIYFYG